MSTDGLQPVLVDQYGGLVTLIDRSDLPVGVSPDCSNVEFFPGGVRSRVGFTTYLTTASNATGMLSYVDPLYTRRLLILMTNGTITDDGAAIPFSDVAATTTAMGEQHRLRGTTLFGRAYFAVYKLKDTPDNPSILDPIPFTPTASIGVFKYDGQRITPVGQAAPTACFTVTPSAGGTMSAGRHDFVVVYETESEYVTPPSAPVGAVFLLNQDADFAVIPIGPGYVTKRTVFATPANSTSFFTLPRFTIQDNTTTTLSGLTFTDSELISGTSLEDYIDNVPVRAMVGVEKYGSRLGYWGANGSTQAFSDADVTSSAPISVGLRSLSFDERDGTLPSEWVATGAGGAIVTDPGVALQAYRITGDGATATRGQIDQVALNYGLSGTNYILPGHRYGLRVRAKVDSGMAASNARVTVRVSASNVAGTGTTIASALIAEIAGYSGSYWDWGNVLGSEAPVGQYVNITVAGENTIPLGKTVFIDRIELYDAVEANMGSVLWVSPPDDPETVMDTTGLVQVAKDDGQYITDVFQLRGNLYVCKDHSLYVVTDNGDEPYTWTVDQVSNTVGTPSPHGVALGDSWAIIVSRNGVYHFTGGTPEKISQEIQPTWDALDWTHGAGFWSVVDTSAQRVYIGVSTTITSGAIAQVFVLDYVEGFGDPIAGGGVGRKWTIWPMAATFGHMVEMDTRDDAFTVSVGTNLGQQTTGALADFTVAFPSYYETAPVGSEIGRSLFDRLILRIRGAGSLVTQSRTPGGTLTTLTAKTLSTAPDDDVEIKFHNIQTQLGFRVGTTGATDYWSLRRLGAFLKQAPYSFLRKT